jgi:two-component system, response regulator RegA
MASVDAPVPHGSPAAPSSVVIADPTPACARYLSDQFREAGVQAIWSAESVEEACQIVSSVKPDLLVQELRFPDRTGFDLLGETARRSPGTRSMVLTSFGSIAATVRAIRHGAVTCLEKPTSAREILCTLERTPPRATAADERALSARHMTLQRAIWEYLNRVFLDAPSLSEAARRLGLDRTSLRRRLARPAPS